jgi:ribosomal protein S18 acetylase RimI-like enzyme
MQARRGELVDVLEGGAGNGAVAELDDRPVGLVTWAAPIEATADGVEVRAVAVDATVRGDGIGRALLAFSEQTLRDDGVARAWLVTTNDNLSALALYQKAGWRLRALRPGAVDQARRAVKPTLPAVGQHGIPLRDELELAKSLED